VSRTAILPWRRVVAVLALSGALCAGAAPTALAVTATDATDATSGPRPGAGYPGHPPVPVPPPLPLPAGAPAPGAGFRIDAVYTVTAGTQTYTCTDAGAWGTTSVPEARLSRYLRPGRIHHYAGPRWTSERDGSTVLGVVDVKALKDGTIPWLLLHVAAHENSRPGADLDQVSFISRINTSGGTAPAGTCTPGTTVAVPYHADYVFWVPTR